MKVDCFSWLFIKFESNASLSQREPSEWICVCLVLVCLKRKRSPSELEPNAGVIKPMGTMGMDPSSKLNGTPKQAMRSSIMEQA